MTKNKIFEQIAAFKMFDLQFYFINYIIKSYVTFDSRGPAKHFNNE